MRTAASFLFLVAPGALAPGVSAQDPEPFQARVDAALDRARPALLEHLRIQRGGVRALLCLAAAHDGVPRDDRSYARALERLSRIYLADTYGAALRLMVMAEVEDFRKREELAARDTKTLLRNRKGRGFSYPRKHRVWDLSNTQYAALGLRAAVALGQEVDESVWRVLAEGVVGMQAEDGGFGYTRNGRRRRPYSSMTVAGIAVLRICKQMLGAKAPAELDERIEWAWRWMEHHRLDIGGRDTLSCYYFHYGLERAAILSDVEKVGDVDWYRVGAEMLLADQMESGAWRSMMEIRPGALGGEGSPVDTAFAILFLRRAFKKVLPPVTGSAVLSLGDNASPEQVERAAARAVARGRAAVPDLLRAMRSRILPRRRAAARALRQIAGQDFGYEPTRPPRETSDAVTEAERWWLTDGRK